MSSVHESYARALFDLALEANELDAVEDIAKGLHDGFAGQKSFLTHPKVSDQAIRLIIEKVTDHPLILKFVDVLNHHHRMGDLGSILEAFFAVIETLSQEKIIHVETAHVLSSEQEKALIKSFKKRFKEPTLNIKVNPAMVGGLRIAYDDKVFDASTSTMYDTLKHTISR